MKICGFNKLTLLDYPTKTACTIFTSGCNFYCPFCHNASLVDNRKEINTYSNQEIIDFLKTRKGKLEGICISGGEPTLQPDLIDFIKEIKKQGFLVKLDTNGYSPATLEKILKNKLVDYVAMDIKNSQSKYNETCGKTIDISKIKKSIEIIKNLCPDYEFRTTIVRELHDEKSIHDIAEMIYPCKRYYLQNFEDSGDLLAENLHSVDATVMLSYKKILISKGICTEIRGL